MLSGLFEYVFGGSDAALVAEPQSTNIIANAGQPAVDAPKNRKQSAKHVESDWILVEKENKKLLDECQSLSSSVFGGDEEEEGLGEEGWIGASVPAHDLCNFDSLSRNKQQWLLTQMLFRDDGAAGKRSKDSQVSPPPPAPNNIVTSITGGTINAKSLKRSGKAEMAQSQAKIKARYKKGVGAGGGKISAAHQNNDRKSNSNGGK